MLITINYVMYFEDLYIYSHRISFFSIWNYSKQLPIYSLTCFTEQWNRTIKESIFLFLFYPFHCHASIGFSTVNKNNYVCEFFPQQEKSKLIQKWHQLCHCKGFIKIIISIRILSSTHNNRTTFIYKFDYLKGILRFLSYDVSISNNHFVIFRFLNQFRSFFWTKNWQGWNSFSKYQFSPMMLIFCMF